MMEPMSTYAPGDDRVPEWTVGDRLRAAREKKAQLDQAPFAELIGVSRGTVSNYERGTVDHYKPIVLRAWAMATGVPLEWLETGESAAPRPPGPGLDTPELRRLTEQKRRRTRARAPTQRYAMPALAAA